ncbi:MAG: FAD-dependent oxidoreductase [Desulfobaccales bacterium]|jgi:NADPH-dependent glutamate synthase beta subunit-like oxidoreductase
MNDQTSSQISWRQKILTECIGQEPPPCQAACPLDIRVREKLRLLQAGQTAEALAVVLERCPFPGILGRICTRPCEAACTRQSLGGPIAVAGLKRYLADLDPEAALRVVPGAERPQQVAVVGGGPAGLMAAYELRLRGYRVTLFEAADRLGGVLGLYVPWYRLPREVLERELGIIEKLGVSVRLRTRLGRDVQLEELRLEFAAVFLAVGCHQSLRLEVPGEELSGVWQGLDFLRAVKWGGSLTVGPRVAVIGGGRVAMDAARSARRLGASQVALVCLESREEMPASPAEVAAAACEGIEICPRQGVKRLMGREGRVAGVQLRAVARVFDEEGRFAPVYLEELLSERQADSVIIAVGQTAEFKFFGPGLAFDVSSRASLEADPVSLATRIPGVFAGGDLISGPGTAVAAFAAGRRAALAMDCYLQGRALPEVLPPVASRSTALVVATADVAPAPRQEMAQLNPEERLRLPAAEVEQGFTPDLARQEAARCLACTCSQCVKNCTFLQHYVQDYPPTEQGLVRLLEERGEAEPLIPYSCHICGLCEAVCPVGLYGGGACLEFREHLVAAGQGPLPQHRGIRNYVRWGAHPLMALSRPDPSSGRARRVFFPGCSLAGHSPHLVAAAYAHLRQRLPDTGIVLNCCGAPSQLLGERQMLEQVAGGVAAAMAKLGAEELIVACTHCQHTIQDLLPDLKTHSIYEVLAENGLPPGAKGGKEVEIFNIHDACGARQAPRVHQAVRHLLKALGHDFAEMAHSRERSICCGSGGMVPAVAPALAQRMTEFRLSEAQFDLVTYCATCRARFAAAGRPALHLLEMIFNPGWRQAKTSPPPGSLNRWLRRWRLKRRFEKL